MSITENCLLNSSNQCALLRTQLPSLRQRFASTRHLAVNFYPRPRYFSLTRVPCPAYTHRLWISFFSNQRECRKLPRKIAFGRKCKTRLINVDTQGAVTSRTIRFVYEKAKSWNYTERWTGIIIIIIIIFSYCPLPKGEIVKPYKLDNGTRYSKRTWTFIESRVLSRILDTGYYTIRRYLGCTNSTSINHGSFVDLWSKSGSCNRTIIVHDKATTSKYGVLAWKDSMDLYCHLSFRQDGNANNYTCRESYMIVSTMLP